MVAVQIALRMVMQLADGGGVIARVAQGARHLHRISRPDLGITQHAVIPRREPREQPRPRRRARGSGRISVGEADPDSRQLVQIRRVDHAVAGGAQTVRAPLVRHQQQNVGPRRLGASACWQKCRRRRGAVAQQSCGASSGSPVSERRRWRRRSGGSPARRRRDCAPATCAAAPLRYPAAGTPRARSSPHRYPPVVTVPASTASGRSVFSRITRIGLPSDGPSSCMPPESVRISAARRIRSTNGT